MNVFFDLDGTLTDPREGIVGCIRYALEALERPVPADADLERFIGPPLRDAFAELLCESGDSEGVTTAVDAYRRRFTAVGMFENLVYDGIPDALATLIARDVRLYLVTSKPRVFATRILEHFGLAGFFAGVYGSEMDGSLSDKGQLIALALADSGLRFSETVMVGDRRHDVAGALCNRVVPVGVLWGYGSRKELAAAGARELLEKPADLVGLAA